MRATLIMAALLALMGVFLVIPGTHAQGVLGWAANIAEGALITVVTTLIYGIVWFFGMLVTVTLIPILVMVASYNDFATEYGVQLGWTVVRDVSNMFFIIVLLVIAVATIFKVESYSYRALLPKLIIMAILINFSRMITSFFIDFAQIIMLTFVNSFRDIAGGNIINAVGIGDILSYSAKKTVSGQDVESLKVLGGLLLGLAVAAVTAGVLLAFILVLVFRVIMLWTLTVLSPLAYLLSAFPGGQKYSSQWWEKFTSHLIVGPVLAFFLWLSFAIMQQGSFARRENTTFGKFLAGEKVTIEKYNPFETEVGRTDSLINFIIVISLLIGSLTLTQQLGVMGGQFAGQVSGTLGKIGYGAAMFFPKRLGGVAAQKWNERTARLLEAAPGEQVKPWKKVAFAALNPIAAYKGWQERTTELREHAQKTAVAGGREVTEEFRTKGRVMIPYRAQVEGSIEAQFSKDFTMMSKEQKAVAMAKLMKMKEEKPHDPEVGRRIRALLRLAAEGGHWDDILLSPRFIEETGGKYVDVRKDGGVDYSFHTVNRWLKDLVGDDREGLRLLDEITEEISKRNTHSEYAGHASYDDKAESEVFLTGTEALANALINFGKIQGDRKMSESPHVFMKIGATAEVVKDAFDQVHLSADGRYVELKKEKDKDGKVKLDEHGNPNTLISVRGTGIDDYTRSTTRMAFSGKLFNDILRRVQGRSHNMVIGGSGGASNVDANSKYAFINNTTDIERLAEYYRINPDLVRASYEAAGGEKAKMKFKVYDQDTGEITQTLDNELKFVNYLKSELRRQGNTQLADGLKFTAPTTRADIRGETVLYDMATGDYENLDDYYNRTPRDGGGEEGASPAGPAPITPSPGGGAPSGGSGAPATTPSPSVVGYTSGGEAASAARPRGRRGRASSPRGPATEEVQGGVSEGDEGGGGGGGGGSGSRQREQMLQELRTIDTSINQMMRNIELLTGTLAPVAGLPSNIKGVEEAVEAAIAGRGKAAMPVTVETTSQLRTMVKQLKSLQNKKDELSRRISARLADQEERAKKGTDQGHQSHSEGGGGAEGQSIT